MKASETNFLTFLRNSTQFRIPIYQRTYSWTERECDQLWNDIMRAGGSDDIHVHFIGSIVYIEEDLSQVSRQSPVLVIDGQQRLTSLTILLAVLAEFVGEQEPHPGFSARKLRNYYLLNDLEAGERRYKLILTQTDRDALISVIENREPTDSDSVKVRASFNFFKNKICEHDDELPVICRGIEKLALVDIALNREYDNPQLIFESMNSTGRELSQADLIRNFVLMRLGPDFQKHLYDRYWRPMERAFGQEGYSEHFDSFMRHYLTVRSGETPRIKEVYDAFKVHALPNLSTKSKTEALLKDIQNFATYYCAMVLGQESDPDLARAFNDFLELKVHVAYSFLLSMYNDYAEEKSLSKKDFLTAVRMVESYVLRRAICDIPTNSLNKTFPALVRSIDKSNYLRSLEKHFVGFLSYRRFPDNEEFTRSLQTRDLYNSWSRRSYWLRRLENHGRKEIVHIDEYSIEHIMPQNPNLSAEWKKSLGPEWERVHQTYLHTLGNLTLAAYNSTYSDRPFPEKRDMKNGFKDSPLKVNAGLAKVKTWDEDAIRARADRLAKLACEVWPSPAATFTKEEVARLKKQKSQRLSIRSYPYLSQPLNKSLFGALRSEVLALDNCVSEEFQKMYISYKAETNIVDVIPQKKQLQLVINLKFSEISNHRGICRDVSSVGHLGIGDVQVRLDNADDLPYIVGLVRQALEKQLGNDSDS